MSSAVEQNFESIDVRMTAPTLTERNTEELVIALVAPVGSGATTTSRIIGRILQQKYDYTVNWIKLSDIIKFCASRFPDHNDDDFIDPAARVKNLQNIGNELRKKFGSGYIADKAIENIAIDRVVDGAKGYQDVGGQNEIPLSRRRVHIIDSLKHPSEIHRLRQVYGDTLWVVGVFAPEEVRMTRLSQDGKKRQEANEIIDRDEDDTFKYGQKVRDTIYLSDFFVRNDHHNEDRLDKACQRFISIIFGEAIETPLIEEVAMYNAASQASTSACLSRQVGASIYNKNNELIGVGANDVPKPLTGGLYCAEDDDNDHRCFKFSGKICHNDDQKSKLYKSVFDKLKDASKLRSETLYSDFETILKDTGMKDLIEFSRAVHAEMAAIISVARDGKSGLVGSKMFCTTFPCHNCARHIVASGISEVYYIEPYSKSKALVLHHDSISQKVENKGEKVIFLQYEGVAPQNFLRLFKTDRPRKAQGRLIEVVPRLAKPILTAPLDGFDVREKLVVASLKRLEESMSQPVGKVQVREEEAAIERSTKLSVVAPESKP